MHSLSILMALKRYVKRSMEVARNLNCALLCARSEANITSQPGKTF